MILDTPKYINVSMSVAGSSNVILGGKVGGDIVSKLFTDTTERRQKLNNLENIYSIKSKFDSAFHLSKFVASSNNITNI